MGPNGTPATDSEQNIKQPEEDLQKDDFPVVKQQIELPEEENQFKSI
jgi:hypothetical protein